MQLSTQLHVLREALAGQTLSGEAEYDNEDGLFLESDQPSEIDISVLHPNQTDGSDKNSCVKSIPDAPTTPASLDSLVVRDRERRSMIPGFRRFNLTTTTEIQEAFGNGCQQVSVSHIRQEDHSHSCVRLTRAAFEQLLQSGAIFPALKDIILHIGVRDTEVEIAPPRARFRVLAEAENSSCAPNGFEIAYGLRFIELNGRTGYKPWSLRQFFVCHKTHSTNELSQWIFFSMPETIRGYVEPCIGKLRQDLVFHPFDIHILIISAAARMWRPYFINLTERMEEYRLRVIGTNLADKEAVQKTGVSMLKGLKSVEIDLLDARLSILATKDTSATIQSLLTRFSASNHADVQSTAQDCRHTVHQALLDQQRDLDLLLDQTDALLQKSRSISTTVADFLNLANGYSMECLAGQAHAGAVEAKAQTAIATGDAKAVKALSVIATIYLPITVVFGFFSTTFMAQDTYDGKPLGNWWLLLAISLPLSALTLFAWCIWIFRDKFADWAKTQRMSDVEATADTERSKASPDLASVATTSKTVGVMGRIGTSLQAIRLVSVRRLTRPKCVSRRRPESPKLRSSVLSSGTSGSTLVCPVKDEKSV